MRIEPLGNRVSVCVSDAHHFTTDTILLADFAQPKAGDIAVELGTGCGTIPLLWARQGRPAEVTAVDIQPEAIELLSRSLALNLEHGLAAAENIKPLLADIRALGSLIPAGSASLVVCNPPYKLRGSGIESPDPARRTARHETDCTLEEICTVASRLLRFSGRLCLCQRPERLSDVLCAMRTAGIEPKRLQLVQGRPQKPPKLFLVEGKRGANPGFMQVLPTLVVEDENGNFTEEMRQIYGFYKEGHQ